MNQTSNLQTQTHASAFSSVFPEERLPNIHYYDPVRYWRKIKPHLKNPELNDVLVTEFNKYTFGRFGEAFTHGKFPAEYESAHMSDWRHTFGHRGKMPTYWRYVACGACHWLVNFNLKLAQLVEPQRTWRIITSDNHSTVSDGADTLFDFNLLALGAPPEKAFEMAFEGGKELKPGEFRKTHFATNTSIKISQVAAGFEITREETSCGKVKTRSRVVRKGLEGARKMAVHWADYYGEDLFWDLDRWCSKWDLQEAA